MLLVRFLDALIEGVRLLGLVVGTVVEVACVDGYLWVYRGVVIVDGDSFSVSDCELSDYST